MTTLVKNILRFAILILVQFFVLDRIHLNYMVTPYIYLLFIVWMPFKFNHALQMILAFLLGFALDSFRHNPGFHAAACVLVAYVRPFLINLLINQQGAETNYEEPSFKSMGGFFPYLIYTGVLLLLHNCWLFLLEAFQFENYLQLLIQTVLSTLISLVLIMISELLFSRKQKFKTNTI